MMRRHVELKISAIFWAVTAYCMLSNVGCTKSNPTPMPQTTADSSDAKPEPTADKSAKASKKSVSLLHTDEKGRKWIGDVPYDVFDVYYEEPLQVAANNQPTNLIASNNSGSVVSKPEATTMQQATEKPATSQNNTNSEKPPVTAASGWKQYITNDVLMSEVKKIRNEISNKLKSVGEYNNTFAEIEILGGTLAALSIIAANHEEPPNWKDKALAIRDLAGEIAAGANGGRGRENYEKCLAPFEKIIVILDGSSPPDLKIPENKDDWYASADTKHLMKRMEASQAWLRLNVNSDKDFKSKVNEITLENSVMAALTKVVSHGDYAYADEEAYQNFIKQLLTANEGITKSISDGNFEQYQSATGAIEKACSACHLKYRFE